MEELNVDEPRDTGPFEYRWPAVVERFDRGWEATGTLGTKRLRLRHGIGNRVAYGRPRVHSVTWVGYSPIVEGVEADDYDQSRALLSAIKRPNRQLVRRLDDIPSGYEAFEIVNHEQEIHAPYSRSALAVKIREDDLHSWFRLAVLRAGHYGRLGVGARRSRAQDARPRLSPVDPGLRDLVDGRRPIGLEELAAACRQYASATGYDVSLKQLRRRVGSRVDLQEDDHREALLSWLRAWGCRHLRREDTRSVSSPALLGWTTLWESQLPADNRQLTQLTEKELDVTERAFADLAGLVAAGRARGSGSTVRFGPTAAAKTLYALRPIAFAPWDAPVRNFLGWGNDGRAYRRYLEWIAIQLQALSEEAGADVNQIPTRVERPESSPPKLIDEFLWIRVTRRAPPE